MKFYQKPVYLPNKMVTKSRPFAVEKYLSRYRYKNLNIQTFFLQPGKATQCRHGHQQIEWSLLINVGVNITLKPRFGCLFQINYLIKRD